MAIETEIREIQSAIATGEQEECHSILYKNSEGSIIKVKDLEGELGRRRIFSRLGSYLQRPFGRKTLSRY
jgi:hypothetical protein